MKYQDSDGEEHFLMLENIGARCAQHEIDHLNGIVFLQRASKMKLDRALKSRPKEKAKRLEYEKRQAVAKYIQSVQSAKDSEFGESAGSIGTGTLPQDTSPQA